VSNSSQLLMPEVSCRACQLFSNSLFFCERTIHFTAKVSEEGNRKCPSRNRTRCTTFNLLHWP